MTYHNQKHLFFLFLLSLCSYSGISQNYFNRIFEFDDLVPNPLELLRISEDSFVVNLITNVDGKRSSSIIDYNVMQNNFIRYDLVGMEPNRRSLLKIKEHYYLYGTNLNEENDSLTLIKMDAQFEILEQTKFPSPEALIHQSRVLEINNSIYGASAYDPLGDQLRLTHVKKIDTSGNVVWTKNYFDDLLQKGDSDYSITEDHFILSSNMIDVNIFERYPQAVKLDTFGNVIWRYDHTEETESTVSNLVLLSDSNIIITSVVDISLNELVIKFIWLDKDGNYLKEKLILPYEDFEFYGLNNFVEGKGDYFFGHGAYRESAPDSIFKESYGLITKFNNDGETLWSHRYKHPDYTLNSDNYSFNDLIEEENGDLVILGSIFRGTDLSPFKVWLFRVDSTGCPDPAYCDEFINFTSTKETSTAYQDLTIFPNPANRDIYIDLPKNSRFGKIEIVNSLGQIMKQGIVGQNYSQIGVDVSDFLSGTYYIKYQIPDEPIFYRAVFIKVE